MNPEKAKQIREKPLNIILICHHQLIREGFEKLCRDDERFTLRHVYADVDKINSKHFNPIPGLTLICNECNQSQMKNPGQNLPILSLVFPNTHLVLFNCDFNPEEKLQLITLGVKGFLSRNLTIENMKKAFFAILDGETWVSRKITDGLLNELIRKKTAMTYSRPENRFRLSRRELEILQAMATGLSNHEISEKLYISEKTVKAHIHHIFKKMGVKNRTQAVLKALYHNPD